MNFLEEEIEALKKRFNGVGKGMEREVCSVPVSKRLKEVGVPQESLWYWCHRDCLSGESFSPEDEWVLIDYKRADDISYSEPEAEMYSAFTIGELSEMLPVSIRIKSNIYYLEIRKFDEDNWLVGYVTRCIPRIGDTFNGRLSDCLGNMLEYVIEQGYLKVEK
ncbi:hypothetical protein DRP04_02140 [Archaeoglobales archaeon]|nr:MAG: hypothetical protein DRP04_02140 [Archaeoglobales archaeon]